MAGQFLKELHLPCGPTFPFLGIFSWKKWKNMSIQRLVHARLFAIIPNCKPKCPLTHEQLNKSYYVHMMENFSAIKRNGSLTPPTASMDFKIISLSKCSRAKRTFTMNPFVENSRNGSWSLGTETRPAVPWSGAVGRGWPYRGCRRDFSEQWVCSVSGWFWEWALPTLFAETHRTGLILW